MDNRMAVQMLLEEILGSREVYFDPPESVKMKYPSFVYSFETVQSLAADDLPYKLWEQYEVKYITRTPNSDLVSRILKEAGFRFDRHYVSDNLHHYVFVYTVR